MSGPSAGVRAHGFRDVTDYIERITYAIWNLPDRDPALVERYYAADAVIHLDAGDLRGSHAVLINTRQRLARFPDFHGRIDETIWTGDEEHGYRTSMRWTWHATDLGGTGDAPPTRRPVQISSIANCVVVGQHIIEEWLATDSNALSRQLGAARPVPRVRPAVARTAITHAALSPGAGELVAEVIVGLISGLDAHASRYAADAVIRGTARHGSGPDAVKAWAAGLRSRRPECLVRIDEQFATRRGSSTHVATRWSLLAPASPGTLTHTMAISHHHVDRGRITGDWTVYDGACLLTR